MRRCLRGNRIRAAPAAIARPGCIRSTRNGFISPGTHPRKGSVAFRLIAEIRGERQKERVVNTIKIAAKASPETNDHQARLLIDGKDWLGSEYLGLDPPMLATELRSVRVGTLIVGRCRCGAVGCDDLRVEASRTDTLVHWTGPCASHLSFDAAQYDAEIGRFAEDTSWETVGRAVEREVGQLFRDTATEHGFRFDWASTRIQEGLVHLSFSKGDEQRVLEFNWDGATLKSALDRAQLFRAERFAH